MLRASSETEGDVVDLGAVREGAAAAEGSGVPHAAQLVAFAEAVVTRDEAAIARQRSALIDRLGPVGMREAASIVCNFQRMVRIADGSGIPLDTPLELISAGVREDLELDELASEHVRPGGGAWKRVVGRVLSPVLRRALQLTRGPRAGA